MPANNNHNTSIDFKLQHLVNKIIKSSTSTHNNSSSSSNNNSNNVLSSKQILETLTTKHCEYKRKNTSIVQTNIDDILISYAKLKKLNTKICSKTGSLIVILVGGNSTGGISGRGKGGVNVPIGQLQQQPLHTIGNKRKRNNHQEEDNSRSNDNHPNSNNKTKEELEELEYEQEAIQHDFIQENNTVNLGGGMLNANLRNRYKDVQRERDLIARKQDMGDNDDKEKEEDDGNKNNENGDDDNHVEKNEFDKEKNDPMVTESTTTTTSTTATKVKSTPSKRRKKKSSKTSSSGYDNTHPSSFSTTEQSPFLTSPTPRPKERYSDLGGISSTIQQIRQLIEYPLSHPELFSHLGIHPPRGVLLRGPPGCGKTHIANAIAGQLNVTFFKISAPEIVSSMSGESESRLRELFSIASRNAPSIIFMDEIDAIAPKRGGGSGGDSGGGGGKGMEKRIVAQLLTCMDSLTPENNQNGSPVMVIAATNRPHSIDSALRRAGRFDREIILGVPDEDARECIIKVMTSRMRLCGNIDFRMLAKKTPGFVGADIRSLTKEAGVIAINRIFKHVLIPGSCNGSSSSSSSVGGNSQGDEDGFKIIERATMENSITPVLEATSDAFDINSVVPFTSQQLEPLFITMDDFLKALPNVQPSSKREGFATVPDVTWDKIGALECIREELTLSVLEPITHPEKFKALGLPLPAGVLLYGPPGCGKVSIDIMDCHALFSC